MLKIFFGWVWVEGGLPELKQVFFASSPYDKYDELVLGPLPGLTSSGGPFGFLISSFLRFGRSGHERLREKDKVRRVP